MPPNPRNPQGPAEAKPSATVLSAARGRTIRDVIAPDLLVLFCGINPSLYSAAVGHHFARPGNRFWPVLQQAGFTPRRLAPSEQRQLLALGIGLTNLVSRASAAADELDRDDYAQGCRALGRKLRRYRPRVIAFLGLGAYRLATGRPDAPVGRQAQAFAGTEAWALPNPSGLNAHYSLAALVDCYAQLARHVHALRSL